MTDDTTTDPDADGPPPLIGERLADAIMSILRDCPSECVVIRGRIGALPHIRYRDGEWQIATWAGPGGLMTSTYDAASVRDAIQYGPRVELEHVDDVNIWTEARGEFGDA